MTKVSQKEIDTLEAANAIHSRLDALDFTSETAQEKADLFKFLLTVGGLSDKGIKLAGEWATIMEKYNSKKPAEGRVGQ